MVHSNRTRPASVSALKFDAKPLSKVATVLIVCVLGSTMSAQLLAAVFNVTATANKNQIAADSAANVRISWGGVATQGTVNSTGGVFIDQAGNVIASVNRPLMQNLGLAPNGVPFTLIENLQIPQSVIRRSLASGDQLLRYRRTFSDNSQPTGSDTAVVFVQLMSSSAGSLSVNQVDLRFRDQRVTQVVPLYSALAASAVINYSGDGALRISWELASPASSRGEVFYRTLQTQRHHLSGGREAIISSPTLPSNFSGNYLLRLRIDADDTQFTSRVLTYYVTDGRAYSGPLAVDSIQLQAPLPHSRLDDATRFSWQQTSNAHAYRLEIFSSQNNGDSLAARSYRAEVLVEEVVSARNTQTPNEMIGAFLIPGNQGASVVSRATMARLSPNQQYLWRVVSLNTQGRVVGVSPLRAIQTRDLLNR